MTIPATGNAAIDLLGDIAIILCVAAVTTVIFQRIKQPVVLGYLIAGLIVGPHVPVPLFADADLAHKLSELGVILLMFSLGLEFRLKKLVEIGPTAGLVAIIQCSLMIWLGYVVGRAFGWTGYESLFAGALLAISSTTIIVKAFAEQAITGKLTAMVFGILIAEDLIAILLLAILTAVASGAGLSASGLALTTGKLFGFLIVLLVVGMWTVPRIVRYVVKLGRTETTVVVTVGICFGLALLARQFGYSVALGAFLAGALVAESGEGKAIERMIEPIRDVFAAIFFVSVGMLIEPALVAEHWVPVLTLTAVVVVGKLVGVSVGAFIAGAGVRTSVQAGMSLAQIGEFSFIIAGVGLALGVTRNFLYPVAVAVSAITTLLTPWLIRFSGPVASYIDSRLPHSVQTFASLYGSWVRQLRATRHHVTAWARVRRLTGFLILDVLVMAGIVIGASVGFPRLIQLGEDARLSWAMTRNLIVVGTVVLLIPFLFGAIRVARALGLALAAEALPPGTSGMDLAAAPRRALLVALQIAILIAAGVPLVALTQPFLPSVPAIVLFIGALILIIPFWKSTTNLQGHVRAGAQIVLEALSKQSHDGVTEHADLRKLIPGLGDVSTFKLKSGTGAVGKTLKQLNLRGLTGASVIAIERGDSDVLHPTGDDVLLVDDTLVFTGTTDAVQAAKELLTSFPPE